MNAEVVETQIDERCLSGIKAELVSMEECWNQKRGKGLDRKVYVGRRITGAMHIV